MSDIGRRHRVTARRSVHLGRLMRAYWEARAAERKESPLSANLTIYAFDA
jgi:hypothetical protein